MKSESLDSALMRKVIVFRWSVSGKIVLSQSGVADYEGEKTIDACMRSAVIQEMLDDNSYMSSPFALMLKWTVEIIGDSHIHGRLGHVLLDHRTLKAEDREKELATYVVRSLIVKPL